VDGLQWPHSIAPLIPGFNTPWLFPVEIFEKHCLSY
jgi:hypothetical protein